MTAEDPAERLAVARREFGEWGGVNSSTEISTTFTGEIKRKNNNREREGAEEGESCYRALRHCFSCFELLVTALHPGSGRY